MSEEPHDDGRQHGGGRPPGGDRTPPQDVAAEQSVLGAMLLSKDAIADVLEQIKGVDFYRPAHEYIFDAILDLYGRGEPADAITVAGELSRTGQLPKIGGHPYLHDLIASVSIAANAGYYAQIVKEKAILRRLVEASIKIAQMGYAGEGDVIQIVDRAQAEVYGVTDGKASEDYKPLADIMEETLDEIEAIGSRSGEMSGVPTGFIELDELTNGLHGGQMVILAGRPAMGKALALDTPLPTPAGWTTMGRVEVGDELLDADGRPTRVVAATDVMEGRPCFEITFSDGTPIVADAEHQWVAGRDGGAPAVVTTQHMATGGSWTVPAERSASARPRDDEPGQTPSERAKPVAEHPIRSIVPAASVPVRCVEVDSPDHLYLASAARIPTHNSTLGLDFARSCSIKHGMCSAIFSLEMGKVEIVMRLLSAEAQIPLNHIRKGTMSEEDWQRLANKMADISSAPLFIDDSPNLTMMEIRAKARRLKQRHDLKLIVIDYLQLMTSGKKVESRQLEVSEFSRQIKLLAKELSVPVVAMSQLNRGPEQRTDKKPMVSDLRESGCLPASTRILRADTGAEVTIGDLYATGERDVPVWSVDDHHRLVPRTLTHAFTSGVKPVFRMTLASGRTVEATGNHPFLTVHGWTPLGELRPGHEVATPPRLSPDEGEHVEWSAVTAIEPLGEQEVFDATVPGTHNFIANGVVAHNSLEQDADIVLLLHREDVYDKESPRLGEADFIVAKNRNGPTRTVVTAFQGHYSRFVDMQH